MAVAVHATRADWPSLTTALARAFSDDPVQRWLLAGTSDFDRAVERFLAFFVEPYFALGHTYVVRAGRGGGVAGAALWAPPDRHALSQRHLPDLFALVAGEIGDRDAEHKLAQLGTLHEHLPARPHFYLGILGVDPAHQGGGFGAALVEPCLRACDAGGFPGHLESSNPRNVPFYLRLGFETVREIRFDGGAGPLLTVMTRPPA